MLNLMAILLISEQIKELQKKKYSTCGILKKVLHIHSTLSEILDAIRTLRFQHSIKTL